MSAAIWLTSRIARFTPKASNNRSGQRTENGSGVSGKTVVWTSTGGTLSTASSQTGSAGGATVKLTSDVAGTFTVTGTIEGVAKTTDEITFTAPAGE
ncbi:Ig-like domain-containing protein [Enterobacter hormaechei]|uniref:Ig-like domain-containing protein n=1 Tax=Enterobacter hormaechei TaxID=158836 RepID=UPI003CE99A76